VLNLCGVFTLLSGFNLAVALCLISVGLVAAAIGLKITSRRKIRTNLATQKRTIVDFFVMFLMAVLLVANFSGWLR
jgi:hypothetical protein